MAKETFSKRHEKPLVIHYYDQKDLAIHDIEKGDEINQEVT